MNAKTVNPNPVLPLDDLQRVINEVRARGFRPPSTCYYKADPRGSEYGSFEVSVLDVDNIRVTHSRDEYTMYFRTVEDFNAWARSAS